MEILQQCENSFMAKLAQLKELLNQFDNLQSSQQLMIEKAIQRFKSFNQFNIQFQSTQQSQEYFPSQLTDQKYLRSLFNQIGTDEEIQQKYFENFHLINQNSHLKSINNGGCHILYYEQGLYIGQVSQKYFHGKGILISKTQIIDGYFYENELQEGLSLYFDADDKLICEIGQNSQAREQRVEIEHQKKLQLFQQYLTKINCFIQNNLQIEILTLINSLSQPMTQIIQSKVCQVRIKSLQMIQTDNYYGFVKNQKKEFFGFYQDKQEIYYGFWKKDNFYDGIYINLNSFEANIINSFQTTKEY